MSSNAFSHSSHAIQPFSSCCSLLIAPAVVGSQTRIWLRADWLRELLRMRASSSWAAAVLHPSGSWPTMTAREGRQTSASTWPLDPTWPGWGIPSCPDQPSSSPPPSPKPSAFRNLQPQEAPPAPSASAAIKQNGGPPEKGQLGEKRTFQRSPPGMPIQGRSPVADTHAPSVQWGSKKQRLHASPSGQAGPPHAAGINAEDGREDALPVGPYDRQTPGTPSHPRLQFWEGPTPSCLRPQGSPGQPNVAGPGHSSGQHRHPQSPAAGMNGCMLQEVSPGNDMHQALDDSPPAAGVLHSSLPRAHDSSSRGHMRTDHDCDAAQPAGLLATATSDAGSGRPHLQVNGVHCRLGAPTHRSYMQPVANGDYERGQQTPGTANRRKVGGAAGPGVGFPLISPRIQHPGCHAGHVSSARRCLKAIIW